MLEPELFDRHILNPIIRPRDLPYSCDCVLNPAAVLFEGETLLLLRVIDQMGGSHLTVARSKDGISDWRIESQPFLAADGETFRFEAYGCEDPRMVYLEDREEYAITYTGFSTLGAGVCLATTKDFKTADRYGLVLAPNNKDAALFPRKINGKYMMLHRPSFGEIEDIWLTESEDLIHWGRPWCIIEERGGPWWDGARVGAGPPPIETPEGWLLIFHGAQQTSHGPIYRVGLALLDLDNPRKVLKRLPRWVFGPHEDYEAMGFIPSTVFPTGTIQKGDEIWMYYGAADTRVCLATAKIETLLKALRDFA